MGHVHHRRDDSARARSWASTCTACGQGAIAEATVIGVVGMLLAVVLGKPVAASSIGHWFLLSRAADHVAMAVYGFVASVLPVWMLLARATTSART